MEIKEIMDKIEDIRTKGVEEVHALAIINLTLELNRLYGILGELCSLATKDYDLAVASRKSGLASEYLKAKVAEEKVTDKLAENIAEDKCRIERNQEATMHAYEEQVHNLKETCSELVMSLKKKADIISNLQGAGI